MELRKFVSETLVHIAGGIEDANAKLGESSAVVNPRNVQLTASQRQDSVHGLYRQNSETIRSPTVQSIEFDIAVQASEGTETKGGIGIVVGAISLGSAGKS